MSLRRFQRGIRQMGNFAGGTSHLARPPAVLPEPDIRPQQFDPDFRSNGIPGGGEIGVVQLYPDPSPFPGFEVPGFAGDELILWFVAASSGTDPVVSTVVQWDSGITTSTPMTQAQAIELPDADAWLFVYTAPRIADLGRLDVVFDILSADGPFAIEWVIGAFPAGTYTDAGDDTYASDTGTFTPTGGPTLDLAMVSPSNLLQYAHAVALGSVFAGVVIAYFEAGSPLIDGPSGMVTEQVDGEIYSWRVFALSG